MDIKEILSIKNLTKRRTIEKRTFFLGLIDSNNTGKKIEYKHKERDLSEMIDYIFKKNEKYKMSISEIIEVIEEAYIINYTKGSDFLEQKLSSSSMHSNYKAFLDLIGGSQNYYFEGKLAYPKSIVPIAIFLIVMCSSKKSLLNMYINKSQRTQICYSDVDSFFKLLYSFLNKFIDNEELQGRVFNSFVKLFDFHKLQSYSIVTEKLEGIYDLIDKLDEKKPLTTLVPAFSETECLVGTSEFEESIMDILSQYESFFQEELNKRANKSKEEKNEELIEDFSILKNF